jgi:hypothetical protein
MHALPALQLISTIPPPPTPHLPRLSASPLPPKLTLKRGNGSLASSFCCSLPSSPRCCRRCRCSASLHSHVLHYTHMPPPRLQPARARAPSPLSLLQYPSRSSRRNILSTSARTPQPHDQARSPQRRKCKVSQLQRALPTFVLFYFCVHVVVYA